MALDALYQQVIMKHYRKPEGFCSIPSQCGIVSRENPSCGDRFNLATRTEGGILADVMIDGSGCAISVASCSLMVAAVKGQTLEDVRSIAGRFLEQLHSDTPFDQATWGEISALEAVKKHKSRITCAELGWKLLLDSIA